MAYSTHTDLDDDFDFDSNFELGESYFDDELDSFGDDHSRGYADYSGRFADDSDDDEADRWNEMWPLAAAMRAGLDDAYLDAITEELELAAERMLASMSDAEAWGFERSLRSLGKGLSRAATTIASNPTFQQVAGAALPTIGSLAGAALGGPVGAMVGNQFGQLAISALPTAPAPRPVPVTPSVQAPMASTPTPVSAQPPMTSAVNGSPAAAQAMVLLQNPTVMQALMSQILGQFGTPTVQGKPVGDVLGLLASTLQRAAADADEVRAWRTEGSIGDVDGWSGEDDVDVDEQNRELYIELVGSSTPGRGPFS